jgi:predicted flap endonuclease-1-like 5' DNA nuclease
MSWKITLGKPTNPYIVGKRWIKKRYTKRDRISKSHHQETKCPGAIYDIGEHYLPDSSEKRTHLWVCMTTGKLFKKSPKISPSRPKAVITKVKPVKAPPKPKIPKKPKVKPPKKKPEVKPPEPKPDPVPAAPKFDKTTPVSEVKGIGKAAFEKLSSAGITTIQDLLKHHSQEIATMIGRKSDAQIKKWQVNAKEMIQ